MGFFALFAANLAQTHIWPLQKLFNGVEKCWNWSSTASLGCLKTRFLSGTFGCNCGHQSMVKLSQEVDVFLSEISFTTQPADDTSEGTVRSNMEIHRCHRLHTEKEERVMLSLVSAYLVWSLQCMPRLASLFLGFLCLVCLPLQDHCL